MSEESLSLVPQKEYIVDGQPVERLPNGNFLVRGQECKLTKNDAFQSVQTGRIVANPNGGKFGMTPANSRERRRIYTQQAERARLMGMIEGAGLDVPDDAEFDEIMDMAGTAEQKLFAHMTKIFLNSPNLRGMAEIKKLLSLVEEKRQESTEDAPQRAQVMIAPQIMSMVLNIIKEKQEAPQVVEGEVRG